LYFVIPINNFDQILFRPGLINQIRKTFHCTALMEGIGFKAKPVHITYEISYRALS